MFAICPANKQIVYGNSLINLLLITHFDYLSIFFAPSACGIIIFGIVAGLRVNNAQQENARQPFL